MSVRCCPGLQVWCRALFVVTVALGPLSNLISSAQAADQLPVAWDGIDLGSVNPAGSSTSTSDTAFSLSAGGPGLSGPSDSLHYVYQAESNDFYITAHVHSLTANDSGLAGLMIREEMAATSNYVGIFLAGGKSVEVGSRNDMHLGALLHVETRASNPEWLRLVKQGTEVQAYVSGGDQSSPGPWQAVGPAQPIASGMIFAGFCVADDTVGDSATATFDQLSVRDGLPPVENGTYTLHPLSNTALLLDGSGGNGKPLRLSFPSGSSGQTWILTAINGSNYTITLPGGAQLALTAPSGVAMPGDKVVLAPYDSLDTQVWSLVPAGTSAYNIYSAHNLSTGLDDFGGSATPGPSIDIWSNASGDTHQEWTLTPASK